MPFQNKKANTNIIKKIEHSSNKSHKPKKNTQ